MTNLDVNAKSLWKLIRKRYNMLPNMDRPDGALVYLMKFSELCKDDALLQKVTNEVLEKCFYNKIPLSGKYMLKCIEDSNEVLTQDEEREIEED